MKIKLLGYETLKRPLTLEGHEIVTDGAEFSFDESKELEIPLSGVSLLDLPATKMDEDGELARCIRWFDGEWWSTQTLLGIPLLTMMNDNLGEARETGLVCKFVNSDKLNGLFSNAGLVSFLMKVKHRGFVTITLGQDLGVLSIKLGAGIGLFNALEGFSGPILDLLLKGGPLLESWSVSIVVSRYPYPLYEVATERLYFKDGNPAEKHLWFFGLEGFRFSFYTERTKVCVASAWARTLGDACNRVYRTCRELAIPKKQFRTDAFKQASMVLGMVSGRIDDSTIQIPNLKTTSGDQC
jgi:hypothetical protein